MKEEEAVGRSSIRKCKYLYRRKELVCAAQCRARTIFSFDLK